MLSEKAAMEERGHKDNDDKNSFQDQRRHAKKVKLRKVLSDILQEIEDLE